MKPPDAVPIRYGPIQAEQRTVRNKFLQCEVRGDPQPQGSMKSFRVTSKLTGKSHNVTTHSSGSTMLPWRTQVQNAIEEAMSAEMVWPVLGPIAVAVTFTVKKPASAPKKRRTYPATRPDVDKLARCVLDALTASGCIKDDGQVTTLIARKVYPGQTWDALFTPGLRLGVMRDDHDD